jgi:hypothetical protein
MACPHGLVHRYPGVTARCPLNSLVRDLASCGNRRPGSGRRLRLACRGGPCVALAGRPGRMRPGGVPPASGWRRIVKPRQERCEFLRASQGAQAPVRCAGLCRGAPRGRGAHPGTRDHRLGPVMGLLCPRWPFGGSRAIREKRAVRNLSDGDHGTGGGEDAVHDNQTGRRGLGIRSEGGQDRAERVLRRQIDRVQTVLHRISESVRAPPLRPSRPTVRRRS